MKGGMFLWNFFRRFPGKVMELLSWQGFKNRVEDGKKSSGNSGSVELRATR